MLNRTEIQSLAEAVTERLEVDPDVEFLRPRTEVQAEVAAVLTENMEEERRINAACERILESYAREIDRGRADPHKMFRMIKEKLAKERGFVL